jgi:DNA-binding transcriptional regulator YhcF (GntR family)
MKFRFLRRAVTDANTRNGAQPSYIRETARALGLDASTVSGRYNELKKNGIVLDGCRYKMKAYTQKVRDPYTQEKATAYALILDHGVQTTMAL